MAATQNERLNERLLELVKANTGADGKVTNWQGMADTLNAESLFNSKGEKWNRLAIANYYQKKFKNGPTVSPESGPTESEVVASPASLDENSPTEIEFEQIPVIESDRSESSPTNIDDLRVRAIVREELAELLKGFEPVSIQKSGRGGTSASVKKSFSLPLDLWAQVESLGGIASNHVAAALRIYLKLKREGS